MLLCPPLDAIENMISKTLIASYKKLGLFPRMHPQGNCYLVNLQASPFYKAFRIPSCRIPLDNCFSNYCI